jgi:MFS transporter, BCD family, chlorophyll transporter
MTGLGLHMTQTAGLALAADRATDETRPRVVALLYVMFLIGMGDLGGDRRLALRDFDPITLVRVVQGCAVATLVLNLIALWKQEKVRPMTRPSARPRARSSARPGRPDGGRHAGRLLAVVALGTLASTCRTCCWNPMAARSWGLSVSPTTLADRAWAMGALVGFAAGGALAGRGMDPFRMAARGHLIGIAAFSA